MFHRLIIKMLLLISLLLLITGTPAGAVGPQVRSLKIDSHPVTLIESPLASVRLVPLLANNRTGQVNDLAIMAKAAKAPAAINGTFFNAYTPANMVSWGTLMINGELVRRGGSGGALAVTADGVLQFSRLRTTITGQLDGTSKADLKPWEQYRKNWYAWDINCNVTGNPQAIVIYTPRFGQVMQAPIATTITVRQGVVTSIQHGAVAIPPDGFVIGLGPACTEMVSHFVVGDSCTYQANFTDDLGNKLTWSNPQHIIQAGPLLVKNGSLVLNIKADNMNEPKFNQKCSWSFVGVDKKGNLVLGVVSGVTMNQMATTVQKLGMKDALALDGNASSCLYHQGKYLINPGRKISNGLALLSR